MTLARLASLPALGAETPSMAKCKVCGARAYVFDVVDFYKVCSESAPYMFGCSGIPVIYYRCSDCEFLFTDLIDDWTTQEVARFIYNDDYIKVDGDYVEARPKRDATFFANMLGPYPDLAILDYGGGAGVMAAELRDADFDAECYDPFASPRRPDRKFDVITCMEVIEHSPDPVETMRDMASLLKGGGCIILGTGVQPRDIESIRGGWWYIGPRNGHVSLQSSASLLVMGEAAGLISYPAGYLHGLSANPSPASEALLAGIGRPTKVQLLSAPSDQLCSDEWHEVEGSFRWTAKSEIAWQLTPLVADCDFYLRVPYRMEIKEGFAAGACLTVDGVALPTEVGVGFLTAKASINGISPVTVRLVTPEPLMPLEVYGTDDRRLLGMAISIFSA